MPNNNVMKRSRSYFIPAAATILSSIKTSTSFSGAPSYVRNIATKTTRCCLCTGTSQTIGELLRSSSSCSDTDNKKINNNQEKKEQNFHFAGTCSRLGLDPNTNRFHHPLVYHENYSFDSWPKNHTFPMHKFERLAHALTTTYSKTPYEHFGPSYKSTLSRPIVRDFQDFFRPINYLDASTDWFIGTGDKRKNDSNNNNNNNDDDAVIDPTFFLNFLTDQLSTEEKRWIGFREQTSKPELIERTVLECIGTILASQLAYKYGIASNVAGGTHHATRTKGAGYTILNDLAITANYLTDERLNRGTIKGVSRVLVIDVDVHQGDGTAQFDKLMSDGRLITLSVHCKDNYPSLKANSTYDIGLPSGCRDDEYMKALIDGVNRAIAETSPDFVLYDAGVDVYEGDKLGRLKISFEGMRQRDRWVLNRCVEAKIPVACVIGGGYDKNLEKLVRRHAIVHEESAFIWRKYRMWEK